LLFYYALLLCCLLLCCTCYHTSLFLHLAHLATLKVACCCFVALVLLFVFCFNIVVFVVFYFCFVCLATLLLVALLHLLLRLALLMPSALSYSRSHTLLPCYSRLFFCFHFCALFTIGCLHLICKPYCSLALFTSNSCLLPCCSHLVVDIVFVAHALLLSRSHWLFTPCITTKIPLYFLSPS
jgi:hypothetical protein